MSARVGEIDGGVIGRTDPVVARVLRSWRRLTGGAAVRDGDRRTVVACSGGADSVALAIVLSLVEPKPLIVHVVHDMRSVEESERDAAFVEGLAMTLGCGFVLERVTVRGMGGNLEANARDARYGVLARMAEECGCSYVATGHHADDQLETVLMRLIRGAGLRGLGGMKAKRGIGEGVTLVRPMLGVSRDDVEDLCRRAGVDWVEDATNADVSYLRNRVRAEVVPVLKGIEGGIVERVVGDAESVRDASEALERLVRARWWATAARDGDGVVLSRDALRDEGGAGEIGAILRIGIDELCGGKGHDSVGRREIGCVVDAVMDGSEERRTVRVGPMVVVVHARAVRIARFDGDDDG